MKAESVFLIYHAGHFQKEQYSVWQGRLGGDMVGSCFLDDSFPHCSVIGSMFTQKSCLPVNYKNPYSFAKLYQLFSALQILLPAFNLS